MSSAISVLRKQRWLGLAAILVLMAVALTAGTLFAANERRQPESPTVSQQSVMDATDPVRGVEPPQAPPAPERVFIQPDNPEVETDLPPIEKEPPQYPNLDSNLNRLAEQAAAARAGQQETNSADGGSSNAGVSTGSSPMPKPVLVTFYVEPEQVASVRQYLEDNEVFIRNVGEDYIEALVPPALLPAASERPGVRRVDTVIPPEPAQSQGSTVSQGVALHQADKWHRLGYRGRGIKVGVIDIGFEGFSQLQGSELPRNVMARCYSDPDDPRPVSSSLADCEVGGAHGTAVAETVIDVAPEVQLYIANTRTSGDLVDAVDWMVENGVHVINRSLGSIYQGPGDGTSYFSNGVIRSIDAAVSGGIVFINSAGNSAKTVWYGAFRDPDGNNWHNFNTRYHASNSFYLWFSEDEGRDIFAQMRWDDDWGGADCNLDLYLAKFVPGEGYTRVVVDDDVQDGGDRDIPRAWVRFEVPNVAAEGLYALFILKRNCADEPDWIQLEAWEIPQLEYYSPGHHIGNPAESRNPGMLAVGAAHWGSPQVIASYSSRGPAVDGRIKPDITGIACGRSTVYSPSARYGTWCWFAGTSQASPHVAGLAALVRQRFPDYTPEQVTAYLKKHADERDALGADNTWGHGLAVLPPGPEPTLRGSQPITDFDVVFPGENSDEAVISWVPVPEATHYRIGYVNLEVDYHLATRASCTMERDDWLQAFVYVDVQAPNVPVRNGRAEYTIRRLSEGARHAFTVLSSNNLYNNTLNVGAEFSWAKVGPEESRWKFVPGRSDLPPGIEPPQLVCP